MLRRNVLLFHQAALGDFIITWPLAMALSRVYPQSRIIYVTHSQKGALAERVLQVESCDSEAGWHGLHIPDAPQVPDRAAWLLDSAHTIVSFTAGQSDCLADGARRLAPHAQVISLDTKAPGDGHITEVLLGQLQSWPMLASAMRQMLGAIADRGLGFSRARQDVIVIHPGAGKDANRWPAEQYAELVVRLRDDGKRVRVLLGETEVERWPPHLISQFDALAEVARPATLLDLLEHVAAAYVFVGNDAGPGHLAGIIGVPTISLFGASDPRRWRPLGPRAKVLQQDPITNIEVAEVSETVARLTGE